MKQEVLRPSPASAVTDWRPRMERGEFNHNAYSPGPYPNGWALRKQPP